MSAPPVRAAHPSVAAWAALRAAGGSCGALVTLVRGDGGAAQAIGAHFALAQDGRTFGSVTIGGCANGRALVSAERVLHSGVREQLTLPLGEEDARALGLGCAGNVDLLVERVVLGAADPAADALDAAAAALERGARAALVTPLAGAAGRLLVLEDGASVGTTGSAARDAAASALALQELARATAESGVHDLADERWLVQLLTPVRTLLVVGATDVAAALCTMAAPLGWRTVLIDPRDAVLVEAPFAAATERLAALPAEIVTDRLGGAGGAGMAVVIVAHDYKVELPVLRVALRSGAPYVGMLGSRKRSAAVRAMLAEDGLSDAELARLHAPIGLCIGARGPAEIAVSIVAELIAAWHGAPPDGQAR
jgi:xanthine dehydrogenase accessory factor